MILNGRVFNEELEKTRKQLLSIMKYTFTFIWREKKSMSGMSLMYDFLTGHLN
jgi:hypothetical protein